MQTIHHHNCFFLQDFSPCCPSCPIVQTYVHLFFPFTSLILLLSTFISSYFSPFSSVCEKRKFTNQSSSHLISLKRSSSLHHHLLSSTLLPLPLPLPPSSPIVTVIIIIIIIIIMHL